MTVETITEQAREIHPLRVLLTCVAGALFAVGWTTGKMFMAAWLVVTWTFVALREGWRSAKLTDEPGRPR